MAETNFIDKKALKHFEKQLAARDKYVKENDWATSIIITDVQVYPKSVQPKCTTTFN